MDTGSPFDLVGRNEVPKSHLKNVEEAEQSYVFNTANGEVLRDEVIKMQVAP